MGTMKIDLCVYSGYKIYPGHGRTLVKVDGKSYKFLSSRTHKAHILKRNPRETSWTVLYRRKHKKGTEEDVTKRRNKRTQKPEVRKAQREQAVRAAKDAKKQAATKKAPAAVDKKAKKAEKAVKNVQKSAVRVGGKR